MPGFLNSSRQWEGQGTGTSGEGWPPFCSSAKWVARAELLFNQMASGLKACCLGISASQRGKPDKRISWEVWQRCTVASELDIGHRQKQKIIRSMVWVLLRLYHWSTETGSLLSVSLSLHLLTCKRWITCKRGMVFPLSLSRGPYTDKIVSMCEDCEQIFKKLKKSFTPI